MAGSQFTEDALEQIKSHGLSVDEVNRHIAVFKKGTPYLNLDRPCTIGDGIKRPDDRLKMRCIEKYREAAVKRRMLKFVPSSGAATRMFKTLIKANNRYDRITADDIKAGILDDESEASEIRTFIDGLRRFAFYPALADTMQRDGISAASILEKGEFKPFLDYLLTEKGLGYGGKPKGLLKFHQYTEAARTAFEEHLVEAAGYSKTEAGECALHFTVSPEHRQDFESLLESVRSGFEKLFDARFTVDFSVQSPSTDTIAVDMDNQPFRRNDGSLLFRPGGHGALIQNLNRLTDDIIFIKNIDNVVHDRFKSETIECKQILCGYLLIIQEKIFHYIDALSQNPPDEPLIEEVTGFVETELSVTPPKAFYNGDREDRRRYLVDRLNRPLRVCGMVPNSGEPGGGPFWVKDRDGHLSIQIVETSQIDPEDDGQQAIQQGLTHFNPVDLVCSIRDINGNPFDLSRYVDTEAVFIAYKSEEGRDLKALEHPGLWNGAMAYWNTVFVEIPQITFNPVKRVTDLLRNPHQAKDQ
ncbi:MAG: DUF4301 family protein [Desulfobacterales bacterium]|nr:DUF4301 family protein [Desulfobacterales bacterium]